MKNQAQRYIDHLSQYPTRLKLLQKSLGPGLITGAADDDPAGIGTYSQAGAQFGMQFLWTALLTWPLMAGVQMACARIGIVTDQGLAANLRRKLPRWVLALLCVALFVANTLNVGADLAAMADAAEMLVGGSSHVYVVLFAVAISWATIQLRYKTIAGVLKWLALALFAYIAAGFLIKPDWKEAFHQTVVPTLPRNKAEWSMVVAILGTTISPYLFFWQSSQEVEEAKTQRVEILLRKYDVGIGTFFSNLVMFFIIVATAAALHKHGITNIESSQQAAQALAPFAGKFATLLYTVGLVGVGLLATPTLTGSAAYALAETFDWGQGLDARVSKARAFYAVIAVSTLIAVAFDFTDLNPIRALYASAVVNGLLAPFLLVGVFVVVRDKVIMRGQTASWMGQLALASTAVLMFAAALGLFLT